MTPREKIAHLLRRFAFGASNWELALYEPLGVEGTLDRLLNYEKQDEGFNVSPWEYCFEEGKDEVYLDPFRIAGWWTVRMLMSQRPLEQRLTLFWHTHFAVGADKVEFGPAMLSYLETLRTNASGKFYTLLKSVAKEPAMLRYLDGDANQVGHPNENFAREVMELFTLGAGHYSEQDVKEAARAFTGWGIRYLVFEPGAEKLQETAKACIITNRPMIAFCTTPMLHDDGVKTVLNRTGKLDGDDVLDILAARPETAQRVCKKLWQFFASADAPDSAVQRLAGKFTATGGDIKAVLREMTSIDNFWQPRTQVKSPCDFVVGNVRALKVHGLLETLHGKPSKPNEPVPKPLRDTAGLLAGTMYGQGMLPLFPPNVAGWEGGSHWITTSNMLQRTKFADLIMGVGQNDQPLAGYLAQQIAQTKPQSSKDIVRAVLAKFDAELPDSKVNLLVQAFDKAGGPTSFASPKTASQSLSAVLRMLFNSPEYQMF